MSAKITYNLEILESRPKRLQLLRDELLEMKEKFGTPRMTEIQDLEFEADVEALIQREDMVVTVTHGGYIKRVPLSTYRAQRRGGRGRAGMATRDEEFVSQVFVADTLTPMLFFSTRRRAARRWSTCCRWRRARRSPPSCHCRRMNRPGRTARSCSRPPAATSGATS
jgi:DNA gyrase/topoisomerase IV subunit A